MVGGRVDAGRLVISQPKPTFAVEGSTVSNGSGPLPKGRERAVTFIYRIDDNSRRQTFVKGCLEPTGRP